MQPPRQPGQRVARMVPRCFTRKSLKDVLRISFLATILPLLCTQSVRATVSSKAGFLNGNPSVNVMPGYTDLKVTKHCTDGVSMIINVLLKYVYQAFTLILVA